MKEAKLLLPEEDADWFLQTLVSMADNGLEISITLEFGGEEGCVRCPALFLVVCASVKGERMWLEAHRGP